MTLDLDKAVSLAMEHNQHLKEVESLVEKARYGYLASISDWLPKLELISQAYQTQHDQIGGSNAKSSFLTQLVLTQTLFSSSTYYNIQLSSLVYKELELINLSLVNDILYDVRRTYYQVILDQRQLETARTHVEILKTLAQRMEERYQIGTATSFDVNQSQVAVANALSVYYKSLKKLKLDLNLLEKVLGYDPGSVVIEISEETIPIESVPFLDEKLKGKKEVFLEMTSSYGFIFPRSNPEEQENMVDHLFSDQEIHDWEKKALLLRPDLKKAENHWKIANKNVAKEKGKYFPKVDLEVSYGGEPTPFDEYPRSRFNNQSFQWGVGINLKWDLFDSFKRERTIRAAEAKSQAEKFSWNYQVQKAFQEVRDQIFSIENAIAITLSSEGNVKLAEQTLAQAGEKLEIGYISIFDYQISVNNFIEAKYIYDDSQFALIDAYYQLRHASGVDVNVKEDEDAWKIKSSKRKD
ncbi:MAG: TolC family protein [Chlamydiales bacterium]|nr:TolC family protein [Chlamydiales bacterium]